MIAADLPTLLAQERPNARRRVIRLGAITPTKAQEDELLAIAMQVVKAWRDQVAARVLPALGRDKDRGVRDAMMRDDARDVEAALDLASGEISRLVLTLTPSLRNWAIRLERWHRDQFRGKVKTASGVDLGTWLVAKDETIDAASARLAGLIRNLEAEAQNRIRNIVWEGWTQRKSRQSIARQIYQEGLVKTRNRARLIARDQTTKLAAVLDEERQVEAGFTRYIWRHSRKLHPRPEHVARDGKLFEWKRPPYDGHPGFAINCGCKAEGYLDLDEE